MSPNAFAFGRNFYKVIVSEDCAKVKWIRQKGTVLRQKGTTKGDGSCLTSCLTHDADNSGAMGAMVVQGAMGTVLLAGCNGAMGAMRTVLLVRVFKARNPLISRDWQRCLWIHISLYYTNTHNSMDEIAALRSQ